MAYYKNREDAGRQLARHLERYRNNPDTVVFGLPRGGVPVAWEVARVLNLPLDTFLVRKLGVPGHEELAMGAIASGGIEVINHRVIEELGIPREIIEKSISREEQELIRREQAYRDNRPFPAVDGKTVILVDDGLATGASMMAVVRAIRQLHPEKVVVAVPTASPDTCMEFQKIVEDMVCVITPEPFIGVGIWYDDFSQVSDEEVRQNLQQAAERELPD